MGAVTDTKSSGRCYRVVAPIGQGGFGTVYRAELLGGAGFSKQVALKMLHNRHQRVEQIRDRLRDEARILGLVQHPAIVRVDGLVQLEGRWTIVMEYVSGANLKDCIETTGPVPPAAALEIAAVISSALYEAYNTPGEDGRPLRILHRDIKPSNIQITASGTPKILDFGIATADFGRRDTPTPDREFGSWDYAAPERLDGIDSPAGDVYSIGTLVYEAIVGEPFGRASGNPVRHQTRLTEGLTRLRAIAAKNHPAVEEFLSMMLAYDPEDRPASKEVPRLAREAAAAVGGVTFGEWCGATVPIVIEKLPLPPLDRLCGTLMEERAGEIEDSDEPSAPPSVAPAFGLPSEYTGDLDRTGAPAAPRATNGRDPGAAGATPMTLLDLATRDISPDPRSLTGRAWSIASVVLLVCVLMLMGAFLLDLATQRPVRPVVIVQNVPIAEPVPMAPLVPIDATPDDAAEAPTGSEPTDAGADAPAEPSPEPRPPSPPKPAAPVPQPTGSPPPAPTRKRSYGRVEAQGDHEAITLVGGRESFGLGRVPVGNYTVRATFADRGEVVAGRVRVEKGQTVSLACSAAFSRCVQR